MTTFVAGAGGFDGFLPLFTINGVAIDATLVPGDVIVMGFYVEQFGTVPDIVAPSDWTVDMSWQQSDLDGNYFGIMFAHKVWTDLDDQGTYQADWTWTVSFFGYGGASVTVGVTDTTGIASMDAASNDDVTLSSTTDYAMPMSSDIFFELTPASPPATYKIIKLATYDFTDAALFLAQRQGGGGTDGSFVSASLLVPDFKEPLAWDDSDIAAGYITSVTPPPEGDIRISGNVRRYRNLSVS